MRVLTALLLTLTILALAITAYSQTVSVTHSVTLPVFDARTSEFVTRITVSLDDIDYERLFEAFNIAFASGAYEVRFDKQVTLQVHTPVGYRSALAVPVVTRFPREQAALWFQFSMPDHYGLAVYSDPLTLDAIETHYAR